MKIKAVIFTALLSTVHCITYSASQESGLLKIAVGGASSTAAGYWVTHTLEDFMPQEFLPNYVPELRSNTLGSTMIKEAITASTVIALTLGIRSLIWPHFAGTLEGNGSTVSAPAWLDQSWDTGGAIGMGLLTYGCIKASLLPDIYAMAKKKVLRMCARLKGDKNNANS